MPRIGGIASFDTVVPNTRVVATASPLTGGGDLSTDRTLGVAIGTSSGTVASGADTRLSNARPWSLFTGNAANGQVPTWNGTTFVPVTPASVSGATGSFTITSTKTSAYTINPGEFVPVDTTGGGVALTLPNNPVAGTRVGWKVVNYGSDLTVLCAGSDVFTRPGSGTTQTTAQMLGQGALAQYDATAHVWLIQSDDLPLGQLDTRYIKASTGLPDATTTVKGLVQLAGDLGGNATSPVVVNGEKTTRKSTAGTPVANGYLGVDGAGLAPVSLLPAASTSAAGTVQLAGDLGGTSSAPTLIRRSPVGGIYAPTYTATMNPTPGTGVHMRVTGVSGNLALGPPSAGGVDGQRYLVELQMTSTSARTITLDPSYEIGANVTSRSIAPAGTATVWVYIGLILRNTTWRVLAVDAGA